MASVLYAEVYLVCLIVESLLIYWTVRNGSDSSPEIWLRYTLVAFEFNFLSNFLFTLFNGVRVVPSLWEPASYFFKSGYHLSLCVAVFTWCGYAAAEMGSQAFERRRAVRLLPLVAPVVMVLANLATHHLFYFDESGAYRRDFMFQVEMFLLLVASGCFSLGLLRHARSESDPLARSHEWLTASFPLCIAAAWVLSFVGEAVPVICVSVMVEMLCLHMGTINQQVSKDKLTEVNNRQNLIGFLDYKLRNHDEDVYLLLMDVDYFKSINDTYGHLEGDAALVRVARALKLACGPFKKRPYIARFGGDEFMVVMEGTQAEARELATSINERLAELNAEVASYDLRMSIGIARWDAGTMADHRALFSAADEALYAIKSARPQPSRR